MLIYARTSYLHGIAESCTEIMAGQEFSQGHLLLLNSQMSGRSYLYTLMSFYQFPCKVHLDYSGHDFLLDVVTEVYAESQGTINIHLIKFY